MPPGGPGVDCPDGLARCLDAAVEVSRVAFVPWPCPAGGPACVCPWERQAACPAGCVAEGVEVVIPPEQALVQLCAAVGGPGALEAAGISLPPPAPGSLATPCDDDGASCAGGVVSRCAPGEDGLLTATPLGRCRLGCASVSAPLDEDVAAGAALALLCHR